jgi:protein Mpv17
MNASRMRAPLTLRRSNQLLTRYQHRTSASVPKQPKVVLESESATGSSSWFWTAWESYTAALFARPLTVKMTTASVIFFVSDSATQKLMDPTAEWDIARSGSGAAFGVVATGWLHYWWGFLEVFVGKRLPIAQHRLSNTLVKVFLDQAIGAPIYIYTYYVITNFLQEWNAQKKESVKPASALLEKTCERAAELLPPTMLRHWTLWPAVHSINFYYSPLHHRVLVQNLVLIGWSGCK